jgi:Raf kinase inhibitor-like YbhB/YbcL family protein
VARLVAIVLFAALVAACGSGGRSKIAETSTSVAPVTGAIATTSASAATPTISVTSDAFAEGAAIPQKFTCDGDNVSPPLAWTAPPAGTVEVALIVEDPDAPGGTYSHWVVFGLRPTRQSLASKELPSDARQAQNSAGNASYDGPCPPSGAPHHYRFTLYALRKPLALANAAPLASVRPAIEQAGIIATGRLVGTYTHR